MSALRRDYQIEQGTDQILVHTERDSAGSAVDNTGHTARMSVRSELNGVLEISLTTENGGIALAGASGAITMTITDAQTAGITAIKQPASRFIYDLELINGSGAVRRVLHGRILILPEVTS